METKNYTYDEELDILYVSSNSQNEKPIGSIVFGSIVFDAAESGKILGVEVDCASKIFHISQENMKELISANLSIIANENMINYFINVGTAIKEYTFQIAVPHEKNFSNGNSYALPTSTRHRCGVVNLAGNEKKILLTH